MGGFFGQNQQNFDGAVCYSTGFTGLSRIFLSTNLANLHEFFWAEEGRRLGEGTYGSVLWFLSF